jgi:hypothetical protein
MRYLGGGVGHLCGAGLPCTLRPNVCEQPVEGNEERHHSENDHDVESGQDSGDSDGNSDDEGGLASDDDGYESLS